MPVRRLAVSAFAIYVVCLLLVAASLPVGRLNPHAASIEQLHLVDCPPPCWIGIIPGATTVEQAKARIVATYAGVDDLSIKDAGFAGVPIYSDVVEINIEGKHFFLYIRLNTSELVDGKNEIVQSIGLFTTRADKRDYAPTVLDVLATFGRPRSVNRDTSSGGEVSLQYEGWYAVTYTSTRHVDLDDIPRFYLGETES
jgi:hypothetical protein